MFYRRVFLQTLQVCKNFIALVTGGVRELISQLIDSTFGAKSVEMIDLDFNEDLLMLSFVWIYRLETNW